MCILYIFSSTFKITFYSSFVHWAHFLLQYWEYPIKLDLIPSSTKNFNANISTSHVTECSKTLSVPPLKLLKTTRADLQLDTFQLHFDLISCCSPRLQHQRQHRAYCHTLKEVVNRCLILKSKKYDTFITKWFLGGEGRQVSVNAFMRLSGRILN